MHVSIAAPSMKSALTPNAAAIASSLTLLYDSRNCASDQGCLSTFAQERRGQLVTQCF